MVEQIQQRMREVVVAVEPSQRETETHQNIFMGIGLLFKGELTHGLGINALPMLCLAREIQHHLPHASIHVLVADLHTQAHLAETRINQVNDVSAAVQHQVQEVLSALGCIRENTHVFRASQHQVFNFPLDEDQYMIRQSEDVRRAHNVLRAGVKIGWQTTRKSNGNPIRDEKFFDEHALTQHPGELLSLTFIRAIEGLSLQQHGSEHIPIPPYFSQDALKFGGQIELQQVIVSPQLKKHFAKIARALMATLQIESRGTHSLQVLEDFINGAVKE